MVGIPANQKHGKVHSTGRENKMEKAITVWDIIFLGLFLVFLELHGIFFRLRFGGDIGEEFEIN